MELNRIIRLILIFIALFISFALVPTVATLSARIIHYLQDTLTNMFNALAHPGTTQIEHLISTCIYLIIITLIVRFILRGRK